MKYFMIVMHDDSTAENMADWESYLATLRKQKVFEGGSSLEFSGSFRKSGRAPLPNSIAGYIMIRAVDAESAKALLAGNPTYESGGTVTLLELVED